MENRELPLLSPDFLAKLESLELSSRRIFRGKIRGERRSARKGQSVEFADYRNYVAGDDLRFIDWNTYARLDRLFLKLFMEEEDLHVHLLLDASASMGFGEPSKLAYAKQVAAALGFVGLVHSDRVVIETLDQRTRQGGVVLRGRASVWRMLKHLQDLPAGGPTDLAAGLKNFCLRHGGKGIVVLLSDLLDKQGFENGLRYLARQAMDVYVIQTLSAEELAPSYEGDLQLLDCEDGDAAEVTATAVLLANYERTVQRFLGEVHEFCTRRGMAHLTADVRQPFEQLVTRWLRTRGLVR